MSNQNQNRLSVSLTDAEVQNFRQQIDAIKQGLPFLIELTSDEMIRLPKIDVSNHDFVRETINVLQTEQIALPPTVSMQEIQKDLELFNQLNELTLHLEQLLKQIRHTATLAGSEAYTSSLFVYKIVQAYAEAGIPGFGALHDRLKQRFAGQGNKINNTENDDSDNSLD